MADLQELKEAVSSLNGPPGTQSPTQGPLASLLSQIASYWWVELLVGALWIVVAVVVLKFNNASIITVGVLTGIMFLLFALEEFALGAIDSGGRWMWVLFGILLTAAGIVCLIHPTRTFAGFADILGFVFVVVGVLWMVQAFAERVFNDLWWLTLTSGILMIVLAFVVSGEFFVDRAFTLLIFAGVWALMSGVVDVVRAFQVRSLAS